LTIYLHLGSLPVAYQRRQCAEIMKLGMQGTTVVVSSGDSGVGSARGTNVPNCLGKNGTQFEPDFPGKHFSHHYQAEQH